MAKIIVVEPHKLLRLGLMKLLNEASPDYHVDATDYDPLDSAQTASQPYDLALLSIPSFHDAHRLIQSVQRVYAPRAILLLSDSPSLPAQARTLPNTVAGHLVKNAPSEIVQASVRLVLAGGTCFPLHTRATDQRNAGQTQVAPPPGQMTSMAANAPPAANQPGVMASIPATLANGASKVTTLDGAGQPEWELLGLTRRQYEVLVLLARGYPMKTVGRYLSISVATAKAHTETLYQRLDVHNRNAAVYAAVAKGATLGMPNVSNGARAANN